MPTITHGDQESYRRQLDANKKPKPPKVLVKRTCLFSGCGRDFIADGRFIRLCPAHRSGDSAQEGIPS